MRNLTNLRLKSLRWALFFLFGLGIAVSVNTSLRAQAPATTPVELRTILSQIETAANRGDLERLMQFYSPDFTTADGLTFASLEQGLSSFWADFPERQYTTILESWHKEGDKIIAETITKIEGRGESLGREIKLTTQINSRQHFQNNKLVYQEILNETTEITTGENPPRLKFNIPTQVKVGQQFDFDVIVEEPLGDNLLAGAVLNERITSDRYLNPGTLELQLLSAGGIFKRATASEEPNNQWFSAIVVRGDGITLVTQRVKVTN